MFCAFSEEYTPWTSSSTKLLGNISPNAEMNLSCLLLSLNIDLKYLWMDNCKRIKRRETRICLRFEKVLIQRRKISM